MKKKVNVFGTLAVCLLAQLSAFAQQKQVTLDYFFNHEFKKNSKGALERFHYTWEDTAQSGYSKLGGLLANNGFTLNSLSTAPTKKALKATSVYWIVDPDTEKETEQPNFITAAHAKAIARWVKKGGVLVVTANDTLNVEFNHLNIQ